MTVYIIAPNAEQAHHAERLAKADGVNTEHAIVVSQAGKPYLRLIGRILYPDDICYSPAGRMTHEWLRSTWTAITGGPPREPSPRPPWAVN